MSPATYARRKAAGRCPQCDTPHSRGHVYCDACRESMRDYHQAHGYATGLAPTIPGPALGCCGRWQAIDTLPVLMRCCGRVYGMPRREATP